jgi:hypothetical protein
MLPTVFAALLVHRTGATFQGTRRSVSTIHRARRYQDPDPQPVWTNARFGDREHLARFLREFRSDRFRLARNQRVYFVSVKPDEMAVLAGVNIDFRPVG